MVSPPDESEKKTIDPSVDIVTVLGPRSTVRSIAPSEDLTNRTRVTLTPAGSVPDAATMWTEPSGTLVTEQSVAAVNPVGINATGGPLSPRKPWDTVRTQSPDSALVVADVPPMSSGRYQALSRKALDSELE